MVALNRHLSIERHARVISTIWLDQQSTSDGKGPRNVGFGAKKT